MTLNIDLLSRLVTWAAEDWTRHTDPMKAVSLGFLKEEDKEKFTKKWDQNVWASAERNGVCETAFCIAGNAVAQDEGLIMSMELNDMTTAISNNGRKHYGAGRVIRKDLLPDTLPEGVENEFGMLWFDTIDDDPIWEAMLGENHYLMTKDVESAARDLLGLSTEESSNLFSGTNEVENVVGIAHAIAESHGETLNVPIWVMEEHGGRVGEYDGDGYFQSYDED